MKMKQATSSALFLALVVPLSATAAAFAPHQRGVPTILTDGCRRTASSATQLRVTGKHAVILNIWPVVKKFKIGPAKAKAIATNVRAVTRWDDLVLLTFLAFLSTPLAKFVHEKWKAFEADDQGEGDKRKRTMAKKLVKKEIYDMKRFGVVEFVNRLSKVALSVYVVDVLSITLSTIGFSFPAKWRTSQVYATFAYATWAVERFLLYKKIALCRFFNVDIEKMGRIDIFNKILNGIIITIFALAVLDWLPIKMNSAFTGLLAFGSAGTLAFTLASQGLVTQLLSGLFLMFSDKMYVGDTVIFGDGTSGQVIRLGFMETVLRGGDNIVTKVPNTMLSSQKVSNVSRILQSQVKQTLRFHYEDADTIPALLEGIRSEIQEACPRLITDGSRPFRVFWTSINEDHLEVVVDTHHNIAPIGDAYWANRQNVLTAITRALQRNNVELAPLYTLGAATAPDRAPERRVVAPSRKSQLAATQQQQRDADAKLFERLSDATE